MIACMRYVTAEECDHQLEVTLCYGYDIFAYMNQIRIALARYIQAVFQVYYSKQCTRSLDFKD